mgnify:CR=1 FL=1
MDTTLENRVTTEFEVNKRRVREVNSLLRKAFGRPIPIVYGINGNFSYCSDMGGLPMAPGFLDRLNQIQLTNLFGTIGPIGEFTNKDGSSVRIGEKYLNETKRYAELYKAKYGKDAQVEIV